MARCLVRPSPGFHFPSHKADKKTGMETSTEGVWWSKDVRFEFHVLGRPL